MKAFFEQIKPFLPVLYIALGIAVGAFGMKSCTPEPKTETTVQTRTDTIPGPSDTVTVTHRLPARTFVERIEVPTTDSVMGQWIEYLWTELDRKQARIDSLEGITAVAVTETPTATLRAHLDMQRFLKEPKQGLWAEAEIRTTDTTRTTVVKESRGVLDYIGFGIHGGPGYNIISRTVDVQIGAGLQIKLDRLFY